MRMERYGNNSIIRLASLGLLGGIALSPALWGFSNRGPFPLLPLLGAATPGAGIFWHGLLALIPIIAVIAFPKRKIFLALLIGCILLLCTLDLNRLQPWVYCSLLISALNMANGSSEQYRWLLAGMYVWSGLNKLGPYFAKDNFPWFCEAFSFTSNLGHSAWLGYGLAFLEMMLGFGLIWGKTRKAAGAGLIGMHLLIIVFLIKLGWNYVVIPWNISLMLLLWLLTRSAGAPTGDNTGHVLFDKKVLFPLVLAWFCPVLYFFGYWPHSLSWQLYSNTQTEVTFYTGENNWTTNAEMRQIWNKYSYDHNSKLLLDDWAAEVLQVPMFCSKHTIKQMGEYLCTLSEDSANNSGLLILRVNQWDKSAEQVLSISCGDYLH